MTFGRTLELGLSAPSPQETPASAGRPHPRELSRGAINQIVDRAVERSDAMQRKAGSPGEKSAPKRKRLND
jgi:hypothetical protein